MVRNVIVIVTLLLVALLPFVTKEHDAEVFSGVRVIYNLPYLEPVLSQRQKLDLYLPKTTPSQRLPLVVWVHGGAWIEGDKKDSPCLELANRGFAAAAINYRFCDTDLFPAQIYDCKAAIRWLRAHAAEYGYDADHIGVWGASAGGHLVSLLGTTSGITQLDGPLGDTTQSTKVQAVSDWCGPTNLLTFGQQAMQPRFRRIQPELFVEHLLGGPPLEHKELAEQGSPINFISKDDPPFQIVHSIEDPIVPFEQSNDFAKALEEAGVSVQFIKVNGPDHIPFQESNLNATYEFFTKNLKTGP